MSKESPNSKIPTSVEVDPSLKSVYDEYYTDGESEWRRIGAQDKVDNIQRLCAGRTIDSVIELGAGEGSVSHSLSDASFAASYTCLEISASGVEAIKARGIPDLRQVEIFDGYSTSFADNTFDLAILSHVLEHVEFPRKLIYEACRIARYLYVEVPLEATIRQPPDFVPNDVGHINFYTPKTIRRLLQTSGVTVLESQTTNPSQSAYTFQLGVKGKLHYHLKDSLLRIAPSVATELFTYHESLLCEPASGVEQPAAGA